MDVINSVKVENKRELILCGANLTEALEKNNGTLIEAIFELKQLHLLRLSESQTLFQIDDTKLNNLTELHSLLLYSNKLSSFPEIGQLVNLKSLDISSNRLTAVKADLSNLKHLSAVNLSDNELSSFEISSSSIRNLNLSKNKLAAFPQCLPASLTELFAAKNEIPSIPEDMNLPHLKILDLSENQIKAVPKSLSSFKFKTLNLKQNPLKDKKLFKFIDQNQSLKAIMDHIQKLGIGSEATRESTINGDVKSEFQQLNQIVIQKFDENFKIDYDASVKDCRNFILCCVVNNLEFTAANMKDFLQFQTKLHDTTCKKRELATIATHDLDCVSSKHLRYGAKHKDNIKIKPLNRGERMFTGAEYFETLKHEADAIRKEKKRSQVTGVYKFLQLLDDKSYFAFLETADTGVCLSLPPLTNSENTKMSLTTKRLLIEVTSHHSAAICNKVMSELISKLNDMCHAMERTTLELQQVRIVNSSDDSLKTLYPSRVDLLELENSTTQITRP